MGKGPVRSRGRLKGCLRRARKISEREAVSIGSWRGRTVRRDLTSRRRAAMRARPAVINRFHVPAGAATSLHGEKRVRVLIALHERIVGVINARRSVRDDVSAWDGSVENDDGYHRSLTFVIRAKSAESENTPPNGRGGFEAALTRCNNITRHITRRRRIVCHLMVSFCFFFPFFFSLPPAAVAAVPIASRRDSLNTCRSNTRQCFSLSRLRATDDDLPRAAKANGYNGSH